MKPFKCSQQDSFHIFYVIEVEAEDINKKIQNTGFLPPCNKMVKKNF